jgi:hypothetical protein
MEGAGRGSAGEEAMHVAKFKGAGAVQVVKHIERDRPATAIYGNERIDAERTEQNYTLSLRTKGGRVVETRRFTDALAEAKAIHHQTTGREARSDAVSLVSCVVQLPREYCDVANDGIATVKDAEHAKQFFTSAMYATLRHFKVELDMVVGVEVHMDETTPHMHLCWVPLRDGKLDAKSQVNRQSLQSFHDVVDRHLREKLQWYIGGLVSDAPSERLKSSDNLTMHEVRKAKAQLSRVKAKTREAVRAYDIVDNMPKSERELVSRYLEKRGLTEDFEQFKQEIRGVANVLQNLEARNPHHQGGRSR